MERDIEYENNNIAYDEQYSEEDGGGIKDDTLPAIFSNTVFIANDGE